jgi:hypothetical protein
MPVITPSKAPNLAIPTPGYDPRQQEILNNQLRLYFNQVDSDIAQLIQEVGNLNVRSWLGLGDGC